MTTRHTEGPWRYLEGRDGEFLVSCESGGFAPLARIKGDKRSTLKDAKANARLIAAAPDLLEALRKFALKHRHTYGLDGAWDEEITTAEKAIAKATEGA